MRRAVFLVDMNAFFISCETVRHPELRGLPAAVAGDPKKRSGIILTANYAARAFGVKTTMPLFEARRLCPDILLLPCDHHYYGQTSKKVMEILSRYTPVVEQNSVDEAWLDMTGTPGEPRETARAIMNEISQTLGLSCSIGIAQNKFLAKMASEMKKPNGITELWPEQLEEKLWPLPVGAVYGVGASTAARLKSLGFFTIGDIARYGEKPLKKALGKYGLLLFALANGVDGDPVSPRVQDAMKSIGRSTTLPQDVTDYEFARRVLLSLTEEVGADARRHGKKGATVQITLKYADFTSITRQTTVPATYLTKEIAAAGAALLKSNWTGRPVRLLGISLSGFSDDAPQQLSLFEQQAEPDNAREEHIEKTVDGLRARFGKDTIRRAALIEGGKKPDDPGQER
jgi:Nucleotidyltransferase/DNA polymerase involved in DNA repair